MTQENSSVSSSRQSSADRNAASPPCQGIFLGAQIYEKYDYISDVAVILSTKKFHRAWHPVNSRRSLCLCSRSLQHKDSCWNSFRHPVASCSLFFITFVRFPEGTVLIIIKMI